MKALVLSSGGADSTTCVGIAVDMIGSENVSTVTAFYGQKHDKEIECARKIAKYYGVAHYELDLSEVFENSDCPLLSHSRQKIRHESYAAQIAKDGEGMVSTYVPFRNGLLLSACASLAASIYPREEVKIYIGAHSDDAAGSAYADCSTKFLTAISDAIRIGTYGDVSIESPLALMNKAEVIGTGISLGVPYELTWSCYEGGDEPCGTCGTCIDRAEAFKANGVKDPAM